MRTEKEIRAAIEYEFGDILLWERLGPGVYYVSATNEETGRPEEYYIADAENTILSPQAKTYGKPLLFHPEYLSYNAGVTDSGRMVLQYELNRYLLKHGLPLPDGEDIRATAAFGREHHPEYFGAFPAPILTPLGLTLRYKELVKGVFVIETDRLKKILAVCHPIWSCELSRFAQKQALPADEDVHETHRYLFFPERSACLALFELRQCYEEVVESEMIDTPAMMNAIWQRYPAYAASHNFREQTGLNDGFGLMLRTLGFDAPLDYDPENLIFMTENIGTNYLKL